MNITFIFDRCCRSNVFSLILQWRYFSAMASQITGYRNICSTALQTRRSENDNTPQPLDQWVNSPFMGQKGWKLIYLPCTVAHEEVHWSSNIVSNSHLVHPKSINLPIPKIWLLNIWPLNPRSRSWERSKFKVTTWVQHPINSHPFMSIHHLIPMIELFLNLTFKSQGQSHSWRSHTRYNILSTHIPFIPCWSALPFLRCSYMYLRNWPLKFKVKVMGEVKVQSHNVSLTSYRLTSLWFHVNRPSHSWDAAFLKFDLENPRSRS